MITRTVSGRTFTYSYCIGRGAAAGAGFWQPMHLALLPSDITYVLNSNVDFQPSTRVTKLTRGQEHQEHILDFGSFGSKDGQFIRPTSLAVGRDGNVYVADEWLTRISIFDKDGVYLGKWGARGSGDGELDRPWGLAFDRDDNLLVVDSDNSRVQRLTKEGDFLDRWGAEGASEGQFRMPWGITLDREGDIYVADWGNGRVQKLTPDGRHLMTFGGPGSGPGELKRPSGVAVDDEGDVYVTDWISHRVHAYGPDGSYITTFVGDARQISQWGQRTLEASPDLVKARNRVKSFEPEWRFWYPTAVAVDGEQRIVIVDQQRHRLQVYVKEKDYVEPQFNL